MPATLIPPSPARRSAAKQGRSKRLRMTPKKIAFRRKVLPIGHQPKLTMKKSRFTAGTFNSQATRTLIQLDDLTNVPRGIDINERARDVVNYSGFKIDLVIQSLQDNLPLMFRWAVVAPRNSEVITTTDFFRNPGGGARSENFDANRTYIEFTTNPINSDEYTILYDSHMMLGAFSGPAISEHHHNNYRHISQWVPLKRQLRYSGSGGASSVEPLFVVCWCDRFGADGGTLALANQINVETRVVRYFQDVL